MGFPTINFIRKNY